MASPLLVFDLDGTLVDSAPDLLATLDAIFPRHGFPAPADPTLRDGIGHGARHLIEVALSRQNVAIDRAAVGAIHRDFLEHYEANICRESRLYAGTAALLDRFEAAGWCFAVCTNKREGLSRKLLEALGVAERFAAICGSDTFATYKPDPAHLTETIKAASGVADRAVMVGDSQTDRDTARNAGVPFVGVTFGYTPVPMVELDPDLLADHFDEVSLAAVSRLVVDRSAARSLRRPAGVAGSLISAIAAPIDRKIQGG
jgi:phosphoglycolate phosphatase